jgi:signal transduction histidine kinase
LRQVIVHLLDNAIRHTKPLGTVWISATVDGDTVSLSVGDTGEGIRSDLVGELFSPFPRIDQSEQEDARTGLGLSFALKVALMHNGEMSVESKLGYGSRFTIVLPLAGLLESPPNAGAEASRTNQLTRSFGRCVKLSTSSESARPHEIVTCEKRFRGSV